MLGSFRPGLCAFSLLLALCPSSAVSHGDDPTWSPVNLPGDSSKAGQSWDPQNRGGASHAAEG